MPRMITPPPASMFSRTDTTPAIGARSTRFCMFWRARAAVISDRAFFSWSTDNDALPCALRTAMSCFSRSRFPRASCNSACRILNVAAAIKSSSTAESSSARRTSNCAVSKVTLSCASWAAISARRLMISCSASSSSDSACSRAYC